MRFRVLLVAAAGAAIAAAGTASVHSVAASGGVVAAATGSGQVDFGDGLRTFSFTATATATGVSGQAQVDNRASGTRAHMVLSCLVVRGATAYIGGTVDQSTKPGLVGAPVLFAVQDLGEGAGAPPDQITALFVGDSDCTNGDNQAALSGSTFPIQEGNVQIH